MTVGSMETSQIIRKIVNCPHIYSNYQAAFLVPLQSSHPDPDW